MVCSHFVNHLQMINQPGFNELLMICKIIYKVCDNGLLTIYGSLWITFVMHKLLSNYK